MRVPAPLILTLLAAAASTSFADTLNPPVQQREVLESVLRDRYFTLGTWRVGAKRADALTQFSALEPVDGDHVYRGFAKTHFAADRPVEITFARDRLKTVKLTVYDGKDFDQALNRMQETLLFMDSHFAGANFEGGLKTAQDPEGALLRKALMQSISAVEHAARKVDEDAKNKGQSRAGFTAFELVMNFWTERVADNNFLTGEFRYRSDEQTFVVSVFDDREFVKSRIPDASVLLFNSLRERTPPLFDDSGDAVATPSP